MAPKKSFKKAYVGIVMDMALARGKISNRMVAQRLGVDEITIRRWRKDNAEFDRTFTEALMMLREKISNVAAKNLSVRKRKIVSDGPKGVTVTVEELPPTHNDLAVFSKLGLNQAVVDPEIDKQSDLRRSIIRKYADGEYTSIQAALLLEAEGIAVPEMLATAAKALLSPDSKGNKSDPYRTMTDDELARALENARKGTDEPEGWNP